MISRMTAISRLARLTAVTLAFALAASRIVVAQSGDASVVSLIEPIRKDHKLPALGAALITSQGLVSSGVTGVRKAKTDVDATIDDHWHLGSDTKAMTAVVLATLVERGTLTWDTSLGQVFPEFSSTFPATFRAITITQLLSHHAGLPGNLAWLAIARSSASVPEQRLNALKEAAKLTLSSDPGTKYEYSNLGYTIAGAMSGPRDNRGNR